MARTTIRLVSPYGRSSGIFMRDSSDAILVFGATGMQGATTRHRRTSARQDCTLINAVRKAGVPQFVYTSVAQTGNHLTLPR